MSYIQGGKYVAACEQTRPDQSGATACNKDDLSNKAWTQQEGGSQ